MDLPSCRGHAFPTPSSLKATDAVQNANDALGRAIMVQDEMTNLVSELRHKLAETEKGLERKNAEILRLKEEVDECEARKTKMMAQLELHKAKLGWGKALSQELVLRILNQAGGRAQRLMVAACREFEALVCLGRSCGAFEREPRVLVLGGMDGTGLESYDEGSAMWNICGPGEEDFAGELPAFAGPNGAAELGPDQHQAPPASCSCPTPPQHKTLGVV